jgi:cytochrome b involved in lipid metabolism
VNSDFQWRTNSQSNTADQSFVKPNSTAFAMSKELTYAEISAHSAKKDLYLVIHDKVYDTSSFVDEHP